MKNVIPIFYAADENYIPYLAVALASLKKHGAKTNEYRIHVLYAGELNCAAKKVKAMEEDNFKIFFEDVGERIRHIRDFTFCRDYYTSAIYYRLFIPELFPQYEKALYLDCDTIALTDVAELYETDIGENLIGAVADQAVAEVPAFRAYVKNALDIDYERYFNSGVIVMNLCKFRALGFYEKFCAIFRSYPFIIAPDQDVLNLICKDKVYYFSAEWNRMPIGDERKAKLVHYNLTMKPWHYKNILYGKHFWECAKETEFLESIEKTLKNFSKKDEKRDLESKEKLLSLASAEAENLQNFIRSYTAQNLKQGGYV